MYNQKYVDNFACNDITPYLSQIFLADLKSGVNEIWKQPETSDNLTSTNCDFLVYKKVAGAE